MRSNKTQKGAAVLFRFSSGARRQVESHQAAVEIEHAAVLKMIAMRLFEERDVKASQSFVSGPFRPLKAPTALGKQCFQIPLQSQIFFVL